MLLFRLNGDRIILLVGMVVLVLLRCLGLFIIGIKEWDMQRD